MKLHKWLNLKNNWKNRERIEGWFDEHIIDNIVMWTILALCCWLIYEIQTRL